MGEKLGAARSESLLDVDARYSYHNLILLCPTHHTEIDNNQDDWPVEKLFQLKSEHELWVNETLSETADQRKLANETAVASIIDAAVTMCRFEDWDIWTSHSLSASPNWDINFPSEIFEFSLRIKRVIRPEEFDELKRAATTLALSLNSAAQTFMKNSRPLGEVYIPDKFYKSRGWNNNYHRDLARYEDWIQTCYELVKESTKAANWFAEVVRRDINPILFAEKVNF